MTDVERMTMILCEERGTNGLVPDEGEDAELQSDRAHGDVEEHVGVETEEALQDDVGVDGDDGSESGSDDEVTDFVEEDEEDADNQTHSAANTHTNPECLVLSAREGNANATTSAYSRATEWQWQRWEFLRPGIRKGTY